MKLKQFVKLFCLILFIWGISTITSNAVSASISASSTNTTVGSKVNITASGTAASWDLEISGSGISTTTIVGYTDDAENGKFSKAVSFTPSKVGTYTFKLTGNITDENDTEATQVNKSVSVTVKAKSTSSGSSSGGSSSTQSTVSFTKVNETVYATRSVNVRANYSTSSSVVGSLNAGDSVTRTGRGSNGWSRVTYNGQTAYISSNYLTTEKPEESNNKNLKSLSIEGDFTLTPEFSADVTEYDLTVGEDIDSIEISAVAEDDNADVEITGNNQLLIGDNTVEIKVTAEDGTVRTYTINVTKGEAGEVVSTDGLSELSVEGYTLSPEFSSNIYEYTLNIADTSVTSLNINAKTNMENATVEIIGNDSLQLGENVITILVQTEEETLTYQIVVNITEPVEEQIIAGIDNNDLFLYGGIGLGVIIVIIIIVIIVKRRHHDDDDYDPYYGGFTSLNNDKEEKEPYKNDAEIDNINDNGNNTIEDNTVKSYVENSVSKDYEETRKSVIEENFGADIKQNDFNDGEPKRKRGKHF